MSTRYSRSVRGSVIRGPSDVNLMSMSFLGFSDRWKYLHADTGFGSTTPAVYTAWNMPCRLTRRVTSLMSTGARRFDRSFLCTHRKLISHMRRTLDHAAIAII